MSIRVTCDTCEYCFTVGDRNAGKRGKCPECGEAVQVPAGVRPRSQARGKATAKRDAVSSGHANSQQKLMLIGGGVAGFVIICLVGVVAYLAGQAGRDDGGPATTVAEVAPNDERATRSSTEPPAAPIAPVIDERPLPSSRPTVTPTATPTGSTNGSASSIPSPEPKPQRGAAEGKRFASVADLIEAVEPSVCRINVESREGSSTGSGFVIDELGIIATNYHVIEGALRATVIFPDDTKSPVIGFHHLDAKKDIALIAITPPKSLQVVKLATELPRKGEILVAIGAPLGLDFSASEGKVAAIRSEEDLQQFGADKNGTWIQSTAPISPGNSGGPLFNMKGEVVAANTMTITIGQNLNFGISAGDITSAISKQSEKPVALSPSTVPKVASSSNRGGRGKTIDGTNTTRGRNLLASLNEVELLVGSFSFDPTGKVEKYVVRLAENSLKQANVDNKRTNAALMAVFMKFDSSGSSGRAKALVIEAHIVVRDNNQLVTVWKDNEDVGSFSEASFIKGNIPNSVRTKVVRFFNGFRTARKNAINGASKQPK